MGKLNNYGDNERKREAWEKIEARKERILKLEQKVERFFKMRKLREF